MSMVMRPKYRNRPLQKLSALLPAALLPAALLSMTWAQYATAQPGTRGPLLDLFAGVGAEGNFADVAAYGTPGCGTFGNATGNNIAAGVGIGFPGLVDRGGGLGLSLIVGYERSSVTIATDPSEPLVVIDPGLGTPVFLDRALRLNGTFGTATLGTLLRYEATDRLTLLAGPWFGLRVNGGAERAESLTGADGFRFSNGGRERELGGVPDLVLNDISIGGEISAEYDIPLSPKISLVPRGTARFTAMSPVEGYAWQRLTVRASVALRFDLGSNAREQEQVGIEPHDSSPPTEPSVSLSAGRRLESPANQPREADPTVRPTNAPTATDRSPTPLPTADPPAAASDDVVPSDADPSDAGSSDAALPSAVPPSAAPPPAGPQTLTVAVDLRSVDSAGAVLPVATVKVVEIFHVQRTELLRSIYFDRGSSSIASRYHRLTPRAADTFSLEALVDPEVMKTHRHALNVLGGRMRSIPGSRITIAGSRSADEPATLAEKRAESVRSYLSDVWSIDPSRVAITALPADYPTTRQKDSDGRSENRMVVFLEGAPELFAPLATEQVEQRIEPPLVKITPSIAGNDDVEEWNLAVNLGERELARVTSRDSDVGMLDLNWRQVGTEENLADLTARLAVRGRGGTWYRAESHLPLRLDRRERVVSRDITVSGESERRVYTLFAFDYDSEGISPRNEEVLMEIARAVRKGARIGVTGYTDRIGDDDHNAGLSLRRARKVAAALKEIIANQGIVSTVMETVGAGTTTDEFDNDLPEGRVLSRRVKIVVEQSVR